MSWHLRARTAVTRTCVCICINVYTHSHLRAWWPQVCVYIYTCTCAHAYTHHMYTTRSMYTQTIAPDSTDLIIMYICVYLFCMCVYLKVAFASSAMWMCRCTCIHCIPWYCALGEFPCFILAVWFYIESSWSLVVHSWLWGVGSGSGGSNAWISSLPLQTLCSAINSHLVINRAQLESNLGALPPFPPLPSLSPLILWGIDGSYHMWGCQCLEWWAKISLSMSLPQMTFSLYLCIGSLHW